VAELIAIDVASLYLNYMFSARSTVSRGGSYTDIVSLLLGKGIGL
jgi:hypothetical protein